MKTVLFTDLDDTLFYSHRALQAHQMSANVKTQSSLQMASVNQHGEAICFTTEQQRKLIELLTNCDYVIPVTGRTSESLARVQNMEFTSYKVCSHGALVLLEQNQVDPIWQQHLMPQLKVWEKRFDACLPLLQKLCDEVEYSNCRQSQSFGQQSFGQQSFGQQALKLKKVQDCGITVYLSIKGAEVHIQELAQKVPLLWPKGRIHKNKRNLALLPDYSSKTTAVAYLKEQLQKQHNNETFLYLGAGDSISDLDFLKLCDFSITPSTSLIHKELWP